MAKKFNPDYLKAAVFGANDGIVTTFAVVAGVSGAKLSPDIIIVLGIANMIADGISMAVGDYLGERSEQRLLRQRREHYMRKGLWKTGLVTFTGFVIAGSLPLLPYIGEALGFKIVDGHQLLWSILMTATALFLVGTLRTLVIKGNWLKNGFEILSIGAIAATAAYVLGAVIEKLLTR